MTREAAGWAVRSGNPEGWVWVNDEFWMRVRRALVYMRFHSWPLTPEGKKRRLCSACKVQGATR